MKNICGYDVNGWRDAAVRNWLRGELYDGETFVIEGSIDPSVVRVGVEKDGLKWIGGAQSSIAPHGRGPGWGEIGGSERRSMVRECLYNDDISDEALAAAFSALNGNEGGHYCVASLDDVPASTELVQERLLRSLHLTKASTRLLVWRSVLAVIYQIEKGTISEGQHVGIICQSGDGFSVQSLLIRKELNRREALFTPERKHAGELVPSQWGYQKLFSLAGDVIFNGDLSLKSHQLEMPTSIAKLAMGEPAPPEILRRSNGSWHTLTPPKFLELPDFDILPAALSSIADCEVILLETLAVGNVRAALQRMFGEILSRPIHTLPLSAISEGAFLAASRMSRREPVYFDFLPQISTIVSSGSGARNFDLIQGGETLRAGEMYRSKNPAELGIPARRDSFSVFLRKESVEWPREAVIELEEQLSEVALVDLTVEQSPAAGGAKLLLRSAGLGREFLIDWEKDAVEVKENWESLIEQQEGKHPTIPERMTLPCGLNAWEPSGRVVSLFELLGQNIEADQPDWSNLSQRLNARSFGNYCISSDGELPDGLPRESIQKLENLTEKAMLEVRSRVKGVMQVNNDSLRFLTWQFKRCPREIVAHLLDAAQAAYHGRGHPFVTHPMNLILVYQGLGRIVGTEEMESAVINLILAKPIETWSYRGEAACLAFLLSRSDSAPKLLTKEYVASIAKRVIFDFDREHGSQYTRFNYAPFLLAGLLRWRLKEPRALVAGQDPIATKLAGRVRAAIDDLQDRGWRTQALGRRAERLLPVLRDIISELEGEGTNQNLLLDVHSLS
jgi:hypothetical protein